jgi:hypothetical protein
MKSFSFRVGATLVASLSLAACGGPVPVEQGQPQQTPAQRLAARRSLPNRLQPAARPAVVQPEVVAELVGHYSHATGRLTFTRRGETGAAGLPRPGFSPISTSNVSLDDGSTGAAGPATVGGNSCTAGQICAMVTLTNDSARQIENPHVEIIEMTGGATLANPSSLPTGYPTSSAGVGGWGYSAVPGGGSDTAFWAFNTSGGADFNFNVKVWGTYTRTSYTAAAGTITAAANVVAGNAAWSESSPPWRDACLFGSVVNSDTSGSPLSSVSGFDYGLFAMPFPFTLYSSTLSSADGAIWQVTTNGAISLQGTFGDPNTDVASAPLQSLLPFWDEKLSISNGQICAGIDSTSAAPNRRYVITWKEAQLDIAGNANNRQSFSVVFQETTDNVFYLYHRWTTNLTGCASNGTGSTTVRGDSATIGVIGDIGQSTSVSFNAAYLPSRSTFAACPGVGYFVKLTATPTNP